MACKTKATNVYRVCAGAESTWNVFADPMGKPVASFRDKGAAVAYAMGLARGKLSWQSLLGEHSQAPRRWS